MNAIRREDKILPLTPAVIAPGDARIDFYDICKLLYRRKGTLAGLLAVSIGAGAVLAGQIKPTYTATATVMLDPRQERLLNVDSVMSGMVPDLGMVESEVEVIRSRGLAHRVVEDTGLLETPEFNPLSGPPPEPPPAWIGTAKALARDAVAQLAGWLGRNVPEPEPAPPPLPASPLTEAVERFGKQLAVAPVGRSRVIAISFTSLDPERAARVANRLAEAYTLQQLQAKFEVAQKATNWLSDRLGELKASAEASEQAVETFRAQSGLTRSGTTLLSSEQISHLNAEYIKSRADWQTAQSRLEAIEAGVRREGPKAVLSFHESRRLDELRQQDATLQRRYAEMSNDLGPKHPTILNLRAEIQSLNAALGREAEEAIARARNDVQVARKRSESLLSSLEAMKEDAARLGVSEVRLHALEQEAAASRTIYETFLNRLKQTEQMGFLRPESWVVSRADIPLVPSFPSKPLILIIAGVIGCVTGLLVVFASELLETGIRSLEEVEARLGIPALGIIPQVERLTRRPQALAGYIEQHPTAAFTEAYRSVLTATLLARSGGVGGRVVLVSSTLPEEGKTLSVLALAYIAARGGYRVLVIDADLRQFSLSRQLGMESRFGLSDFLLGKAALEDIVHHEGERLDVIGAGVGRSHQRQMLVDRRLDEMLANLRGHYDVILIDSPPILPVSDTKILARCADACLYVVRWRRSRARTVAFALKELQGIGAPLQGAILTRVDQREHARYTYSDAEKYSPQVVRYYNTPQTPVP